METFLQQLHDKKKSSSQQSHVNASDDSAVRAALAGLAVALSHAIPLMGAGGPSSPQTSTPANNQHAESSAASSTTLTASWLLNLCSTVPSELDASYLAESVWDIAQRSTRSSPAMDEASQQAALFDILGASDEAMTVLFEIMPVLSDIPKHIPRKELSGGGGTSNYRSNNNNTTESTTIHVNIQEETRQLLLQQAMEAAQLAELARQELELTQGTNGKHTTHSVVRQSDRNALKQVEKLAKKAAQALAKAKQAGAIIDETMFWNVSAQDPFGPGGLLHKSQDELETMQTMLLPSGSKQYYNDKGLPLGSVFVKGNGYEKVIIPPSRRDESQLARRLVIRDIMEESCQRAFDGTATLNPMQSTVFEVAFWGRENMLVCAPTGAGKTNVAMLTVVAHMRDVGLLPSSAYKTTNGGNGLRSLETGHKVVYIAPMKALAQEVVEKFSSKLKPLKLVVRELTGDMQLTRAEAAAAHVIVTTPEKWDVITRKSGTDELSLGNQCGLLIIDEVHLLADERGAVIESVVARHHRLVEARQRQLRIVALSATLPNYQDVASFLQVPERGLFFFGPEHRPVPLQQTLIGIAAKDRNLKETKMNELCYDIVIDSLRRGYQVMVFVHSRKGTGDTARALADLAAADGTLESHFVTAGKDGAAGEAYSRYKDKVTKSRDRQVAMHFQNGMGMHHAGMLRGDRKLTESMFSDGAIKVLCCTATLAWGINLPAHSVVIKGTEVYNPEKGGAVDLSILDVQQIFGRAGRPQFDSSGEATLITSYDAYQRYITKLVRAVPIESNFIKQLPDHLNAEIVGGTVSTVQEAVQWLGYTYLHIRMLCNPLAYGIKAEERDTDETLVSRRSELIINAAKHLAATGMIAYGIQSGNLSAKEMGRTAAHFYIQSESVGTFNELIGRKDVLNDADLLHIIASASEFQNMKVRQEELEEMEKVAGRCPLEIRGAGLNDSGKGLITSATDKAFVLIQAYIARERITSFTLISDVNYISANAGRIARALFEMRLKAGDAGSAMKLLRIAKSVDNRVWWFQSPLRQFEGEVRDNCLTQLEHATGSKNSGLASLVSLLDMQPNEVGELCHWSKGGEKIQSLITLLPYFEIDCRVMPITGSILKFHVTVMPVFKWHGRWHGGGQGFWIWIENTDSKRIYHQEQFTLTKAKFPYEITIEAAAPIFEESGQFLVKIISDSWVGVEQVVPIAIDDSQLPRQEEIVTDLQDLTPLPVSALQNKAYERLYPFHAFNPIQTQLFHVLLHTDCPILLGAPTGSGKTIVAELALLRMKQHRPSSICVYIAPLKALARERLKEWRRRLSAPPLKWNVLELSGDTHYDSSVLDRADVLVCTPEKWDLLSRGWRGFQGSETLKQKSFVKRVGLLVLDEVHLLGEERGAVLEAIVSRTRFISRFIQQKGEKEAVSTRIIGLSTSLSNAVDLADWIGIDTKGVGPSCKRGLFNFSQNVRPVPIVVHIQGYSGKHYCPRMATMNKPCYAAIKDYAPTKPTLIFVASRRQTRLTAIDLISYAASDEQPTSFLSCSEDYIAALVESVRDESLRHTLSFGIGLHHAGLTSADRDVVEKLFSEGRIRVLVATATLAWGLNLPARLVIVKGTEYFDGKSSRYVDYPLTDVLQMIGRAGRPGLDTQAFAVVMATEDKKNFYKKFLYNSFPVESCLQGKLCENINAEIASGTISNAMEALGYLSWTFLARRVKANPSYYGAASSGDDDVEDYLYQTAKETLAQLQESGCIATKGDEDDSALITPSPLGIACASYYLNHCTPKQMQFGVREGRRIIVSRLADVQKDGEGAVSMALVPFELPTEVDEIACAWLLYTLCSTHEFDEHPVRHNEEFLNEELNRSLVWGPDISSLLAGRRQHSIEIFQDPHTKCFLLLQAYLERAKLPITDYVNDTMSVVDNVPRLLAAMEYIACAEKDQPSSFELITQFCRTRQYFATRSLPRSHPLSLLPGVRDAALKQANGKLAPGVSLGELRRMPREAALDALSRSIRIKKKDLDETMNALYRLPLVRVKSCAVSQRVDKKTAQSIGTLDVKLEVERANDRAAGRNSDTGGRSSGQETSLTVLVGTYQQKMLLGQSSIRLNRFGTFEVSRTIDFEWNRANADGGTEGGRLLVRLLFDNVRGLDADMAVALV